ncbi:hypothetical protein [Actinomycetospora aeridis]|uniref:DnaJ-like protein n=1 Tax=Actinomycetospora aeridis TaxID=3129231 RepID=A0ABU8N1U4_9PSEU
MSAGPVAAVLREVADDELYRRNAFRVTGVATDAGARAVRERQKKDAAAAAVGVAVGSDPRLPLLTPTTDEEVRAAYDVLADPRRRLVHELLWFWGDDVTSCGCRSHQRHDEAVEAHALALDAERAGDRGRTWRTAREQWSAVLADAATWTHLEARVAAIGDARRLDARAVEELRAGAPSALVASVVSCAARSGDPRRLREEAERWGLAAVDLDDLLLGAVAERVERVEGRLVESQDRLGGDAHGAVALLRPQVLDDLAWIDGLAPHDRSRLLSDLRDRTAIVLNNAALEMLEDDPDAGQIAAVFGAAEALATSATTRRAVDENRRGLSRRAAADKVLRRYGLTSAGGGVATLVDRMTAALQVGRFGEAARMAGHLLTIVEDPADQRMLRDVRRRALEEARHHPHPSDRVGPARIGHGVLRLLRDVLPGVLMIAGGIALAVFVQHAVMILAALPLILGGCYLVDRRTRRRIDIGPRW